jgi:glycosyltransferase involved in cell wall biosynthesis
MHKEIYVLHEYGANTHYRALEYLASETDCIIKYHEFSIIRKFIKAIYRKDLLVLKKQLKNIVFLIQLLFTQNKKIVLGIAPYDIRLIFLNFILRRHQVYYHTSWTCWDRSFYPKKLFVGNWLIHFWEEFVKNTVVKIFAVSEVTKNEIIKNIEADDKKIVVVNHSFDNSVYYYQEREFKKRCLYVGRFESQKGIDELLEYFSLKNNLHITLVGDGGLTDKVKEYANKYSNIKYISFVSDQKKLAKIYNEHDLLLLNSKKVGNWEELFGMVLIEAMACGVIPIATEHKGPSEIISDGIDGFLSSEIDFINKVDFVINSELNFDVVRNNAVVSAKKYSIKEITKRWEAIFE